MEPVATVEVTAELTAEKVVAGGDALCRDGNGRVVLVPGLLPGEVATVAITPARSTLARGTVTRLESPSPDRIEPQCRNVRRGCGGCPWAHVAPAAQVGLKAGIVAESLARIAKLGERPVEVGPALPAEHFRTTVRVAGAPDGRVGFRSHRSHRVVAVPDCLVTHPLLDAMLPEVRIGPGAEVQLRVSAATGERNALALGRGGRPRGLPAEVTEGPGAIVHETIAGRRLRVSAPSFFQTRADGAAALVDVVARAVAGAPEGPFVDAYGGVGLFAATVAGDRRVTVVESSASSCADAALNLPGAAVRVGPVERWDPTPAAVVVADPPRAGLQAAGAAVVAATGARRVALVSCDAVAHARDVRLLVDAGYELVSTTVVEMFPHTPHIEVVSRLDR